MKGATLLAVLTAIAACLLLLYLSPARADPLTPVEAFAEAKAKGVIPPWADVTDRWRIVPRYPTSAFLCIENRQAPGRWVATGPNALAIYTRWLATNEITVPDGPFQPPAPADLQACWPAPPPAAVAIGDPVYDFIAYTAGQGSPLKWGVMDQLAVARQTLPGETCAAKLDWIPAEHDDPKVAWYAIRDGGMTRCRAP